MIFRLLPEGFSFSNLVEAISKGFELAGDLVNQIEIAFQANQQRGVGVLWLPKSRQTLYYSIDWRGVDINSQRMTTVELHLLNVIFGLSMWQGIILCHRALMLREPIVKVAIRDFSNDNGNLRTRDDTDVSLLWSMVERLKENLFTEWNYVSPASRQQDEKFNSVEGLLRQGNIFAADAGYSLIKSNPRDTLQCILPVIPRAYRNHRS